ncbi:MAG: RNA-binding protein [Rhodospirillaceae bacterium]|nr:RNA-binding protein [Rhodospirillaceae bacterium]
MTYAYPILTEQEPAMPADTIDTQEEDGGSVRCCLVSGERLPKTDLLRFVINPANQVVFDATERLPGRGLWLKAERDMIDAAASKRLFSKATRHSVEVPEGLTNLVAAGLKRRCLDRLGLARRAGLVVMGFEQVRAHIKSGQAALLLEASDGSADGRRKITEIAPGVPVVDGFTGFELGQALGRDHLVHVALSADKLTNVLHSDVNRLRGVNTAGLQDRNV